MRFTVEQRFSHPAGAVASAFASTELYAGLGDLGNLSRPEVVAHERQGDRVHLELRYRFTGDLSPAARAVVDPSRLSWIERSSHDLSARSGTFVMVPDHYADRLRCQGTFRYDELDGGSRRSCEGELRVRAPLVATAVERAIVSGLREHLDQQVPEVEVFLGRER